MEEQRFYVCVCHTEAIAIDVFDDDGAREFHFSVWNHGTFRHSWRDRISDIWRIITRGYPYLDQIVLPPEKARELGQYLIDCAEDDTQ